jgi:type IV pilus assembly protein PilV
MKTSGIRCVPRLCRQGGVGIIEILVAVLVLSIGLLGLAGLQMRTLRNSQSALERGVAVMETHAIADAMRADRVKATTAPYVYNIGIDDPTPTGGTTFAGKALEGWRNNLTTMLGADATGSVDCNGALCTIVIRWNDSRGTAGAVNRATVDQQTLNTEVQL